MNHIKTSNKKLLVIANPVAGKMKVSENFDNVQNALLNAGFEVETYFTKKAGDAVNLVKQHYKEKDMIISAGGDGTLHEVITGILKENINLPVGYLPAGTTNDMATSLSIPTDMIKAVDFISNNHNHPKAYDVAKFNEKSYFTYVASFGAFSKTAYATPQWFKNLLGYYAYILSSVTMLDSLHPYELTVQIDDKEIEGKFIFGGVSNSSSIAGIIDLSEETNFDDGKFEILLLRYPTSLHEAAALLECIVNKHIDNENILLFHATNINFNFKTKTAWTLDGEFGGNHSKVNIQVLNNAIEVIY